jgi:hypothetical protein
MLPSLASAGEWRGDGTPLYIIAEGKIHGSVFVSGGHGLTYENPYIEYFDLPGSIEYARLYIPMWNYNENDWIEVSINGQSLGRKNVPDYLSAWGVSNYAFNVTNLLATGKNKVSVDYHNSNGAPYNVGIVAVYRDYEMPQTRFWITEGNYALSQTSKIDTAEIIFSGSIPDDVTNATLWTTLIAGNEGEVDKVYFNSHLIGEDVGRRKSGAYVDMDTWQVGDFLDPESNIITFERGDEQYLHPISVVLAVEYPDTGNEDDNYDYIEIYSQAELKESSIPRAVIIIITGSIIFFIYRLRSKR